MRTDGGLEATLAAARACTRCPALVDARERVVPGAGAEGARLVLVGASPTREDEALGAPLTGRAGALLDELLGAAGIAADDVFRTTAVRCRPPGRDPRPEEIAACSGWLEAIVAAIGPRVVAPLGAFAAKLVRGDAVPLARIHGEPLRRVLGERPVRVVALHHPDAALYAPELLELLRADIATLPALLAAPIPAAEPAPAEAPGEEPGQLGLF